MKMNTYVYLLIPNSCIRPVALSCKELCFISGMDVINDLCICVLHLKLWMLAMIQGLALQSQGSFSFTKEGSYRERGYGVGGEMMRLKAEVIEKLPRKSLRGRPKPRAKCDMKTTYSPSRRSREDSLP